MRDTIGCRHLALASNVSNVYHMHTDTLERSIARTWTRPMPDHSRDYCDFTSAISGDDLARIAYFEPKHEPRLWADVTTHIPPTSRVSSLAKVS